MARSSTAAHIVKSIGASGQISLGKEFAGRQVLVETPAAGVWVIRTATIIPDHEAWLHQPEPQQRLKRSIEWATKNAPQASDPGQLVVKKGHARRKVRSTRSE